MHMRTINHFAGDAGDSCALQSMPKLHVLFSGEGNGATNYLDREAHPGEQVMNSWPVPGLPSARVVSR